jgi:hypothetical protein
MFVLSSLFRAALALTAVSQAPLTLNVPAYPAEWIFEAEHADPTLRCAHLIYKNECRVVRHGRVTLKVSLKPDGTVKCATVSKNEINLDRRLVAQCAMASVKKWPFRAPVGVASVFEVMLVLADKC